MREDGLPASYTDPNGVTQITTAGKRIRMIADEPIHFPGQPLVLVGDRRPMTRMVITRVGLKDYTLPTRNYRSWVGLGTGNGQDPSTNWKELRSPQSVRINQQLDSGIATCSIQFTNIARVSQPGELPVFDGMFMDEGHYTMWKGTALGATKPPDSDWTYLLQPDRVIRTFQGYGANFSVPAWQDPNLIQTGVWLIDTVTWNADLSASIECRDMAALLVDQYIYPPVVPQSQYPLQYTPRTTSTIPGVVGPGGNEPVHRIVAPYQDSSNTVWMSGNRNASIHGHYPADAFDGNPATYWLSIGNSGPDVSWAFEWLQVDCKNSTVGSVKFLPWAGNYIVYLGIKVAGKWQGTVKPPYDPSAPPSWPNDSDEFYILKTTCGDDWTIINTPNGPIANVESLRLTFHHLADSGVGTYQYRAGVKEMMVFSDQQMTPPSSVTDGSVQDWTDIIKDIVSMGGFWYPVAGTGKPPDASLTIFSGSPTGQAFGNFENAGAGPLNQIPEDVLDKKALMDVVTYVKDILGFTFSINGQGEVVWRMPNLWRKGSWVTDNVTSVYRSDAGAIKMIDEDTNLLSLSVTVTNRLKRKQITIGVYQGGDPVGTVPGMEFIPANEIPLNAERDTFWFDQDFASVDECVVMADMIKVRQAMQFRRGTSRIPADPTIEIDDQVIINEKTTSERYGHHVSGINSDWRADGTWTMELEHYWLYVDRQAGTTWVVPLEQLAPATQAYIHKRLPGV